MDLYPTRAMAGFNSRVRECQPEDVLEALEDYFQSTAPNPPPEASVGREFRSLVIKIGVFAGILLLLFTFLYGFHRNADPGMAPAVRDGDLMIFYRLDKKYRPGNLILLTFQGKKQVRRVVATAGDTVDITGEGLLVNGALQQESLIYQETQRYAEGIEFPLTLGEGQVFVLGDARENAADSRVYGPVNAKDIRGSVITILRRRSM
jgi:signal peptidase I